MRRISSTSRNPAVVMRPVRAPFSSRIALEATVVPCRTSARSPPPSPGSPKSPPTPSTIPRPESATLDEPFLVWMRPPWSSSTMSVKVPPMSTPTRKRAVMSLLSLRSLLEDPGQPQGDVGEDHHQDDAGDIDQDERRHPDEHVG